MEKDQLDQFEKLNKENKELQEIIEKIEEYFQDNKWKIGRHYFRDDGSEDVYNTTDLEKIGKILTQL